jgi:bacteriorhodopsin
VTGFGVLSSGFESMFYTLLDIISKVGFGLLSLNTLKQLEQIPIADRLVDYPQLPVPVGQEFERRS